MNKYKINKTTDQVSMLVANIRTLFSTQGNYDGLNNAQAISFGVVPEDMITTSNNTKTLKNAFNGDVTIETSQARSAVNKPDSFVISYAGLSQEACVTVATGDWGSGQASGLIGIAAGSAGVTAGVKLVYVDSTQNVKQGTGLVVAAPGGTSTSESSGTTTTTTVTTPVSVTYAVAACNGGGSGNTVAWKYY
jgi:hypothetical protein